jgi:hypothetical protein
LHRLRELRALLRVLRVLLRERELPQRVRELLRERELRLPQLLQQRHRKQRRLRLHYIFS